MLTDLYPLGQVVDEGDTFFQTRRVVKGLRHTVIFHDSVPKETAPADRVPSGIQTPATRKAERIVDLHADKFIDRTPVLGDEFGNPADSTGVTQTMVSDNTALVTATDNGDGSFRIAAVGGLGNLGVANVTYHADFPNGTSVERVEAVNVIAGGAETVTFSDSAEQEVTPDTPPAPPVP